MHEMMTSGNHGGEVEHLAPKTNHNLTTIEDFDSDSDSDSDRAFDSHPPRESKDEPKKILEMRAELAVDLESLAESQRYPELVHDWKMVRFLRGYQGSVTEACKAYRDMLEFRTTIDAAGMRAEILAAANGDLGLLWTYNLPRFSKIRDGVWKGANPAVMHGFDKHGHLIVLSFIATYRWHEIIDAELGDMWQDIVLYSDMHLDLLLHELSVDHNRMVARRDVVDAAHMQSSHLGMGVVRLLSKMSASSKHYPESLCRTDVVNFGMIATTVLSIVKPFLPPQTRRKLFGHRDAHAIEGINPASLPQRLGGACACVQCRTYVDQVWNRVSVSARSTHTVEIYVHASDVGHHLCSEVTVHTNDIVLSVTFVATTTTTTTTTNSTTTTPTPTPTTTTTTTTTPTPDKPSVPRSSLETLAQPSTEPQKDPEILLKDELVKSKELKYKCTTPGTYRMHMRNTHSMLRSKHITYRYIFVSD